MNRENESKEGKKAARDDIRRKKFRDLSIYGSTFYVNGYNEVMDRYIVNKEKKEKDKNKGGK